MKRLIGIASFFVLFGTCAHKEPGENQRERVPYEPMYYDYIPGVYLDPNTYERRRDERFYDYSERRFRAQDPLEENEEIIEQRQEEKSNGDYPVPEL